MNLVQDKDKEKSEKKFVSSEKVCTFAVPFEKNGIFYGLSASSLKILKD
jgi:hypothetical protein